MKVFLKASLFFILLLINNELKANNIQVSAPTLGPADLVNQYTLINFDVSWDNSWRTSSNEANWDAAWIFIKYKEQTSSEWRHAYLNDVGHTIPVTAAIEPGFINSNSAFNASSNPVVGVFIHRTADGTGSVNFQNISLRWNYGVNGVTDISLVDVCVFAIEMVHIPDGSFYLGDGISSSSFTQGGLTNTPFLVTSESITLANTSGSLWAPSYLNYTSVQVAFPDDFPKGYAKFYTMKYELSQKMWVEFLNKLTRTQQGARTCPTIVSRFMNNSTGSTSPTNRNGVKLMNDPGGALPREYGNDLNENGITGEAGDGEHIACNFLSFADLLAFADWSGLRPLSELEYEKMCRGSRLESGNRVANMNVLGEYVWGTSSDANHATSIINSGQNNEEGTNATTNANVVYNNTTGGPLRSGNFARSATTRVQSGGSYYGVMDLNGNLWESCYSVYATNTTSTYHARAFKGWQHGNGVLNSSGNTDVSTSNWPYNASFCPYARKGGAWNTTSVLSLSVSDRSNSTSITNTTAETILGIRLGRSAM